MCNLYISEVVKVLIKTNFINTMLPSYFFQFVILETIIVINLQSLLEIYKQPMHSQVGPLNKTYNLSFKILGNSLSYLTKHDTNH